MPEAVLGGDPSFTKELLDSAWYVPLFWDTVFMARGRIGYVSAFMKTDRIRT